MKKVRYLAGAVGAAPILGLMMPTGTTVAAVTHTPGDKGKAVSKTVSLAHIKAPRPHNVGDCPQPREGLEGTTASGLEEFTSGTMGGSCISIVSGFLKGGHTELLMRTRYYNFHSGKIGGDHFNTGERSGIWTVWKHTDKVNAFKACIALVENSPNHTKKYGDACTSFT